jgi:hypothetical protein
MLSRLTSNSWTQNNPPFPEPQIAGIIGILNTQFKILFSNLLSDILIVNPGSGPEI